MIWATYLILICCIAGLVWAYANHSAVKAVRLEGQGDEEETKIRAMESIGQKIQEGASTFLNQEYKIMGVFILIFSAVVFILVDILANNSPGFSMYATIAYIVGSVTSMGCGYIGMSIAVQANFRTAFKAMTNLSEAFKVAFQAGCVMGFSMIALSLLILLILLELFVAINKPKIEAYGRNNVAELMEFLAAYGLGGSTVALFARVGGGIYTKAADVGADLVGKVEEGLAEDSPRNPATIADNVGDNVGDIAGMGADLFGSFAESTCAALVFISSTPGLIKPSGGLALYFPLMLSGLSLLACIASSAYGVYVYRVDEISKIEQALKLQLSISTIITLALLPISVFTTLPNNWAVRDSLLQSEHFTSGSISALISVATGLLSGLAIGYSTDYYTSHAHEPVRDMAHSCSSGPAINIIYGLALGYDSTVVPVIFLAITAIISLSLCGLFGVALAAIGMLSTLPVCLAIDAYGPIADNAGGIAEMAELGQEVREKTDALDSAGNTTAAVGKGFAIGSAALVSLALYGAFVTRAKKAAYHPVRSIEVTQPYIFGSLLIGAMLPYAFSAMTMKAVGKAAKEMVSEVRRQFRDERIRNGEIEPDYKACITVSTQASLKEMVAPGLLVILTPIVMGVVFHPVLVAGLLPGALLSGIQLAISMSNSGGAWDNAKKYIEAGNVVGSAGEIKGKGSEEHKAAVIGDTVGDPLKDTSGPSLNILIKLMAIISLVFAGAFSNTAWLSGLLRIK
jgi:H+-translocating diphosphatase